MSLRELKCLAQGPGPEFQSEQHPDPGSFFRTPLPPCVYTETNKEGHVSAGILCKERSMFAGKRFVYKLG